MKNKLYASFAALALIVGGVVYTRSFAGAAVPLDQKTTYQYRSNATTTRQNYLSYGKGTTTAILKTVTGDQLEVLMIANASSTGTVYKVTLETSPDTITWYPLNYSLAAVSTSSATTIMDLSAGLVTYQWTPGVTATATKAVVLPAIGEWTRVSFTIGTSTDITSNGALHATIGVR